MSEVTTYRVAAYRIADGEFDEVIASGKSLRNAEAVEKFAVLRQGCDARFFAVEPEQDEALATLKDKTDD